MINPISLLSLRWQNYFDIIIVAMLIYSVYVWLRGTRAFHILIGLGGLGMLYGLSRWSGLFLTSWLLQYLLGVILLLAIVIFQPEIRQLLEKVSPLAIIKLKGGLVPHAVLSEVAEASFRLADERTGALLVFPRATPIADVIHEGVSLDSLVSQELLLSIFQRSSPIHDGAVIIEKNRVIKAGCYLPLSTHEGLPPKYGTRHRAAIGITEHGDALCIAVSEERGVVALTQKGEIETMTGEDQLRHRLEQTLAPQSNTVSSLSESLVTSIKSRINYQDIIHKNLSAKFLALGLSCMLWFLLVGQQWSETFTVAKLEYQNFPADLGITSDAASEVQIRVRGPRGSIATLSPDQVRVLIDMSGAKVGVNTIPITKDDLRLPFGLEVTSIEPSALVIQFDRILSRRFPVGHSFRGKLPSGLRLAHIAIDPSTIELRGPENELDRIESVTIPPIDLSTVTKSQIISSKVQIIPPLSYAFRMPIPEVMVSLSLTQEAEEEEEQPVSNGNDENDGAGAQPLAHTRVPD